MNNVDVIIISWAKDEALCEVTKRGIKSLLESAKENTRFNVIVVESNPAINYDEYNKLDSRHTCKTIRPLGEFNYNGYLNQGIQLGNSKYVALCNSDLTYEYGWADSIIAVMEAYPYIKSSSPWCPQTNGDNKPHLDKIYIGHEVRKEFNGWCIFQQRDLYNTIGKLNEDVKFWYSDNILAEELKMREIEHALVPSSVVNHHENTIGKTAQILSSQKQIEYTSGQYNDFVKAYNKLCKLLKS